MSKTLIEIDNSSGGGTFISFWGGNKTGKCIQITPRENYICLNRAEVLALTNILITWLEPKEGGD